jgi:hypothetical protein
VPPLWQPQAAGLLLRRRPSLRPLVAPGVSTRPADAYGQVVSDDQPLAWWRGNGDTTDTLGNAPGGVLFGGTYGAGLLPANPSMQSFNVDGIDDRVDVPDQAQLDAATAAFTVEAWINPDTFPTWGTAVARQGFWELTLNNGKAYFAAIVNAGAGNVSRDAVGTTTLSTGTLYHLVGTFDGTNVRVYVNGTEHGSATGAAATFVHGTGLLIIGGWASGAGTYADFFDGRISEVAVYSRALSPAEITEHWVAGSGITAAGSITLAGTPAATATVTSGGSVTLAGTATVQAAASAAGAITLGGTAAPQAPDTAAGTVTLGGTATAAAPVTAAGTVTLGGTATARGAATAAGTVTLGGTAVAQAAATAAGAVTLGGTATGQAPDTAAGGITLGGTATARAAATSAGSIVLSGTAAPAGAPVPASGAGSITLGGTGSTTAAVASAGTITLAGLVQAAAAQATAGLLTLGGGPVAGSSPATALGGITLSGSAAGSAVSAGHITVRIGAGRSRQTTVTGHTRSASTDGHSRTAAVAGHSRFLDVIGHSRTLIVL